MIDKIKNLFIDREPKAQVMDPLLEALLGGETITREKAMKVPAVAKNVGLISDIISTIPIRLYRKDKNGKTIEVVDERVDLLNKDTKDTLSATEFKKAMVEDYLLEKGGYAVIVRKPRSNKVESINYVKSENVQVLTGAYSVQKSLMFYIDGEAFDKMNIIRILRNTRDGGSGVSLVKQIETALLATYETMSMQLGIVRTGGNKKGFLKSQKRLSEQAMDELKKAWKRLYSESSEKCIVLNDGIDFQEAAATPIELQMNETITTFNKQIDEIFRYDTDFFMYFKKAIAPILAEFEASLNRDLLLEKEKQTMWFQFDTKDVLKGNLKERYEAYRVAKDTGWLTLNEIRDEENKEKIEGLDIVAMSLGQVIFDTNTKKYFVPNTGENTDFGKKGGKSE